MLSMLQRSKGVATINLKENDRVLIEVNILCDFHFASLLDGLDS